MARRGFSQNLPNFVKGGAVVGACTYQSQASRSSSHYHDDSEEYLDINTAASPLTSNPPPGLVLTSGANTKRVVDGPTVGRPVSPCDTRRLVSAREVDEATRVLFHREEEGSLQYHHHHHQHHSHVEAVANASASRHPQEDGTRIAVHDHRSESPPGPHSAARRSTSVSPPRPRTVHAPTTRPAAAVARLHPKPVVHEEIVRFGVNLANNPRIQSAICESFELRNELTQLLGEHASEEQVQDAVDRLCGVNGAAAAGGGGRAEPGAVGGESGLEQSFEVIGGMDDQQSEGQRSGLQLPSLSYISLGRSMRRKDAVAGTADVPEELLDELLRSDDEEDLITSKLFKETSDDQIRKYLRNLDLECVICHEFMVEATAVDCGEGHAFCRDCIGTWLYDHDRCPTCQKRVAATVPMRQLDVMIEKYVRASNLWDEITSYYRRRTLSSMRRDLHLDPSGKRGHGRERDGASQAQRDGQHEQRHGEEGEYESADEANTRWWQSDLLTTALSVAAMILLMALFRRGVRPCRM